MTEAPGRTLPPGAVRWSVLALLSLAMFGSYYAYDAVGPLADILQQQLHFTDTQIGGLNAIYSAAPILIVVIGGVIVDRIGTGRAMLLFAGVCMLGSIITALSPSFLVMAFGRLLFGLGGEAMNVAITTALGQWFAGRALGFAFGCNLSIARAGSYAVDKSTSWASGFYARGWQPPLWLAAGFMLVSLAGGIAYWALDRWAGERYERQSVTTDKVVWGDLLRFDLSFWYVVGLCVTFYSVIFPFRSTFSIKYFQHAHGLSLADAGTMNSYVFLAAIFATPLFGLIVDRTGHRALAMALGTLLLAACFPILGYTQGHLWTATVLLGIAFSLVPAVMWPSVPYLVAPEKLGTAYGVMTMLQNIGLLVFNLAAGALNDHAHAGADNPGGYLPMLWMFAILSLSGLVFSFLLRARETGPHGHDLERAKPRAFAV